MRTLGITQQKRHVAWILSSKKNKRVVRGRGLKKDSYNEIRVNIRSIQICQFSQMGRHLCGSLNVSYFYLFKRKTKLR